MISCYIVDSSHSRNFTIDTHIHTPDTNIGREVDEMVKVAINANVILPLKIFFTKQMIHVHCQKIGNASRERKNITLNSVPQGKV